jgi:hypothetical protein
MRPFRRYFERGAPDGPPKKRKNRESGGKPNQFVVGLQRRFVSLHGTIKRVELRILRINSLKRHCVLPPASPFIV